MGELAILISGSNYGAGKSTTAQLLKAQFENQGKKVLVCSFGDYVKWSLKKYYNWDGKKDEKGRYLLQHYATDLVRNEDATLWADTLARLCNAIKKDWDIFIIDDWRFKNEYESMKKYFNLITLRITRSQAGNCSHESENDLNSWQFDYNIANNGDMDDLNITLKNIDFSLFL